MNLKKTFTVTSILSLFLLSSCDKDDNGNVEKDILLLPKTITEQYNTDAEPLYLYTSKRSFEYDDHDRPITITYSQTRRGTDKTTDEQISQKTITLSYNTPDSDTILALVDKSEIEGVTKSDIYYYVKGKSAASVVDISYIDIFLNENTERKGTIEYNNVRNQVLKYSHYGILIPEEPKVFHTQSYNYDNGGNIIEYTCTQDDYNFTEKYEYDNKNGIYKQLNVPQWLIVTLLDHKTVFNNATSITLVKDNDSSKFGDNKYTYNVFDYPVEIIFAPDDSWFGISASKTTIEYIKAKNINTEQ